MGGGYYERDSNNTSNLSTNQTISNQNTNNGNDNSMMFSSSANDRIGLNKKMHPLFDPKRYLENKLISYSSNPIVFALDVTGSMGEWTKVIYDKLPMFYGQIMMNNYLKHPSLSFCAVGDAVTDTAPLQISEFANGVQLDEILCNIFLEGKGGGNKHESYELAAYFYDNKCVLENADIPFFFLTCDEMYYDEVTQNNFKKVFGHDIENKENKLISKPYWEKLLKKFNFFILRKSFKEKILEPTIQKQWEKMIGKERVLKISNPKAVIDVILGAISLTSGARDLTGYLKDLKTRGQSVERILEVKNSLTNYWHLIEKNPEKIIRNKNYVETKEVDISDQLAYMNEFFTKALFIDINFNEEKQKIFKDLISLSQELKDKLPEELVCPLTHCLYCDPVKTPEGKVYERLAIENWLENNSKDPLSEKPLKKLDLIVDYSTVEKVETFYESSKILLDL